VYNVILGPGQLSRYSGSQMAGGLGVRIPVGARDSLFSTPIDTDPGVQPPVQRGPGLFNGGKTEGAWR
jgi:hypothetical protein